MADGATIPTRPVTGLRGARWTFASNARETWLVLSTTEGPRGARLRRDGDDVVAYEVGGFVVLPAADREELFTIPADDADADDPSLCREWIDAGRPRLTAGVELVRGDADG